MISDNPNDSLGIVDWSLYTRRIVLKDDYHKKRKNMLAYIPVEFNYFETLAKIFISPATQNQFIHENISNNAPVRRIAVAIITNSEFTRSFTENPFCDQQFVLRQIRILKTRQAIVDFDAADNFRLYITTKRAMNFQDDIPSIAIDIFKDHYVLLFDLTSMQDATENCYYPELVGEPLMLELNFTFPLEHVSEFIVMGNECLRLRLRSLVLLEKTPRMDSFSLQQIINRIPQLRYRYRGSFSSDYVPAPDIDTFAIVNTQPSNMQGKHWIMIANSCQK